MKSRIVLLLSALAITIVLCSLDLPKGWFQSGSDPNSYEMGVVGVEGREKKVAAIRSKEKVDDGFGTLMQTASADAYKGKRVRMTGYMRSQNVTGWAGFWFRVDKAGSRRWLAFDNMHERAVRGNTGWKQYEIVLDVPKNASGIAYGALLSGEGQIWFDDISFEVVTRSVPVTGIRREKKHIPREPVNLNFDE